MFRHLYRFVLLVHPPAFRRRFAEEMLCTFEESSASEGPLTLVLDGVVSLARQWVLRSGAWKIAFAIVGGCLEVTVGGLIWIALGHAKPSFHRPTSTLETTATESLVRFIVSSTCAIVLLVAWAVLWMRNFSKRSHTMGHLR